MKLIIKGSRVSAFKAFITTARCISETMCFHLSEDGMFLQNMDTSHSAMYEAWFPKEWFETFAWESPDMIVIDSSLINRVMGCVPSSCQKLMIGVNISGSKVVLTVFGADEEVSKDFEMGMLDSSEISKMDARVKNEGEGVDFTMRAKDMYDIVHEHAQFGTNTTFHVTKDTVAFVTSGEVTQRTFLNVGSGVDDFVLEDGFTVKNTYSVPQLEKMLKFHTFGASTYVKVAIDHPDRLPLTLTFPDNEGCYVRAFIAPMIDDGADAANDEW